MTERMTDEELAAEAKRWDSGEVRPTDPEFVDAPERVPKSSPFFVRDPLKFAITTEAPQEICRLMPDGSLKFAEGWDAEKALKFLLTQRR